MRRDVERGQTTILVLGLAVIIMAVAGVAVDGTRAFLMRRTMQSSADAAALAGASSLDSGAYYGSGGRRITVDPDAAGRTAANLVAERGLTVGTDVIASTDRVRVVLRGRVPTTFLGLVGIRTIPVAVEATARPLAGDVP